MYGMHTKNVLWSYGKHSWTRMVCIPRTYFEQKITYCEHTSIFLGDSVSISSTTVTVVFSDVTSLRLGELVSRFSASSASAARFKVSSSTLHNLNRLNWTYYEQNMGYWNNPYRTYICTDRKQTGMVAFKKFLSTQVCGIKRTYKFDRDPILK